MKENFHQHIPSNIWSAWIVIIFRETEDFNSYSIPCWYNIKIRKMKWERERGIDIEIAPRERWIAVNKTEDNILYSRRIHKGEAIRFPKVSTAHSIRRVYTIANGLILERYIRSCARSLRTVALLFSINRTSLRLRATKTRIFLCSAFLRFPSSWTIKRGVKISIRRKSCIEINTAVMSTRVKVVCFLFYPSNRMLYSKTFFIIFEDVVFRISNFKKNFPNL